MDVQFRYVNEQAKGQLAAGEPVISVDTKKRELAALPLRRHDWHGGWNYSSAGITGVEKGIRESHTEGVKGAS